MCMGVCVCVCMCVCVCVCEMYPFCKRILPQYYLRIYTCCLGRMKFLNMEFEDNKVKESLLDIMVSIVEHISTITTALQYVYDK